jgi:hypothetical protein
MNDISNVTSDSSRLNNGTDSRGTDCASTQSLEISRVHTFTCRIIGRSVFISGFYLHNWASPGVLRGDCHKTFLRISLEISNTYGISRPTDATCDRFLFSIYMCITLHVSSVKRSSSGGPHCTYSLQFLCLCLSAALSCKFLTCFERQALIIRSRSLYIQPPVSVFVSVCGTVL